MEPASRKAVVIGAGGHATSVAEAVLAAGYTLVAFVDETGPRRTLLGYDVLDAVPRRHLDDGGAVVLAIGDNAAREAVWHRLRGIVPIGQVPALVHPSASVASLARVRPGAVVLQRSVVASAAFVGFGCLLNSGAILDHESRMDRFASLAPGAIAGGRTRIGARSALSIGAVVRHGLSIGPDTVVGAASYVDRDVPARVVAYGVPSRVIRERRKGDPYL